MILFYAVIYTRGNFRVLIDVLAMSPHITLKQFDALHLKKHNCRSGYGSLVRGWNVKCFDLRAFLYDCKNVCVSWPECEVYNFFVWVQRFNLFFRTDNSYFHYLYLHPNKIYIKMNLPYSFYGIYYINMTRGESMRYSTINFEN
ncbi:MAG: hypothetical protein A4E23_00166 [Methanomethylovorans sp. PtaU1.Bin073]|nr:MAG: hypothetical protein A4E23_00166 [Methanomethylovorans sp. PtaU1.Bin073]